MTPCAVCNNETQKYRCPTCKIKYCSLGCYKKHKDACQHVEVTPVLQGKPPTHVQHDKLGEDFLNDDVTDKVPSHKLKQLEYSEDLATLLCNPHLRQLLLAVDGAQDKADIMKAAMQEPLFVEFADQCLKIVEPVEDEM